VGLQELISTLKKNEQKQIDDIWQQARSQADTIRTQISEAIAEIERENEERLSSSSQKSVKAILAESETVVRGKKLQVYQNLKEVLRQTAESMLPELRRTDYENIFRNLVSELPDLSWELIVVNPEDIDLAAEFFSQEIIRSDDTVIGGLVASCADGRIVVDNSFEKRLARRWPYMLPELIRDIEGRYE